MMNMRYSMPSETARAASAKAEPSRARFRANEVVATWRSVHHLELDLIGIPFQLRRVHRFGAGREGVESSRDFGPHAIGDAVLAASERPCEEGHSFVAELDVGTQVVAVVAAADLDRLEAGGLVVLKDEVFVVILAVNLELNLEEFSALERRSLSKQLATIALDLLSHGLPSSTGDLDCLVVGHQSIQLAVDFDLQPRSGDRVLQGEVGHVGVEVERPLALLLEAHSVSA